MLTGNQVFPVTSASEHPRSLINDWHWSHAVDRDLIFGKAYTQIA
jgi:hypothetical protein